MNFVEELRWRGILHDIMPETEPYLEKEKAVGYIGFDPTSDSLHIGSLVPIIILIHFQRYGHTPIILVGGATGMVGDPSGKSEERNLLDEETLNANVRGIEEQLKSFLKFEDTPNPAKLVNNYDWMKPITLLDFARDIGKHITVNYMMAKDSVKKRISSENSAGMSFTEFTYQLFQGYDFLHLYNEMNCTLQMGGSDQWGNITTGTELIRRKSQGKAYALTCNLITKSDGSKFGKTAEGNIWLDATKTSTYKFYQYWLNTSDKDAASYIKIFTFLDKETIESLIEEHEKTPEYRVLQKKLAEEVTKLVHGEMMYEKALKASAILFGKSTTDDLHGIDEQSFLDVFEGVPMASVSLEKIKEGLPIIEAFVTPDFLKSNAEVRRGLKENSISVNKEKVNQEEFKITEKHLIADKYILLQRGKKNYFVLKTTN